MEGFYHKKISVKNKVYGEKKMKPNLCTIEVFDRIKAKRTVHVLDDMGILVSSKCKCVVAGRKECQYGPGQQCKKGYIIIVPRKDREVMINVANAVDTTGRVIV